MIKGAVISKDQKYRYRLWRIWDEAKPLIVFVGLNPSTADAEVDDPTIRKCINYAAQWGYGGLYMLNLFAYRATDPKDLLAAIDPIGPQNNRHITNVIKVTDKTILAWGNLGKHKQRAAAVMQFFNSPYCLKVNQSGSPSHPLYLRKSIIPILYSQGEES